MESTQPTAAPSEAAADAAPQPQPKLMDLSRGLRFFLLLDSVARLFIWSKAVFLTSLIYTALGRWPQASIIGADTGTAWLWTSRLMEWVFLYNLVYVFELAVLRLLVPTPREGRYSLAGGRTLNRQVFWSCLVAVLTKARFEAPFPGFLVFQISNLYPMKWLMNPIFGPRSKSCYVTDPQILDPHMVTIGRNVTIGFRASIAGHYQDRDCVVFKRTIIGDNVVIGGHAVIFGGVHIKDGAVIGAGSVVLPNTVVEPNEFWFGIPARRRKVLDAPGQLPAD